MQISRKDNVERIYEDLRAQILSGKLKKGDRLVETAIAREYKASRLHVRSAFRLLEVEKLAKHIEMKGFVVLGISDDIIEEVIEIRNALEAVVLRRVIQRASEQDIEQLERIVKRVEVFINNEMTADGLDELRDFYDKLYEISGYERITGILRTYSDYISLIKNLTAKSMEENLFGLQNLKLMMKAIAERDQEEAIRQMKYRHKYLAQVQ